jgi:DNA-binding response OmpR family regulator
MVKILVVDDNQSVLNFLELALGAYNYDVTVCPSPVKALGLARRQRFDVIILDFFMPRLSGALFLKLLRRGGVTFPKVIVITGKPSEGLFECLRAMDVYKVHAKPFSVDELLITLGEIEGSRGKASA